MNKEIIRKLQANLLRIDNGEKFFFNVTQYKNLGLIKSKKNFCKSGWGGMVVKDHSFYLTEKGKRIANTIV